MTTPKPACDILIVDDNKDNLRVLRDLLADTGYRLRCALHGQGALAAAQAEVPDLILLDLRLPDLPGEEVCRRLHGQPATAEVPVIVVSAQQDTADKVRAFQAGAVDYVTKPFQAAELLARIETHLTLRSLREELQQLNEDLEQRVAQRTAALEQTCDRLSQEIEARKQQERFELWYGRDRRKPAPTAAGPLSLGQFREVVGRASTLLRSLAATDLTPEQRRLVDGLRAVVAEVVDQGLGSGTPPADPGSPAPSEPDVPSPQPDETMAGGPRRARSRTIFALARRLRGPTMRALYFASSVFEDFHGQEPFRQDLGTPHR